MFYSYKCDSQCALEMRCPPGLIFDDSYQRCEWPGMDTKNPSHRLSSFTDQDKYGNSTRLVNHMRVMNVAKRSTAMFTSTRKRN
jgi:hypothetical protein